MQYVELLRTTRNVRAAATMLLIALVGNFIIWRSGGVTIDHHIAIPLTIVWACAALVASIFASVIGGSLAAENDGHLPVAWTKPTSRLSYAAAKMTVNVAGILVVYLMTSAVVLIYFETIGVFGDLTVPSDTWWQLLRFLIAPLAFYGLLQALTSTLSRAGMVLGFTWLALLVLLVLQHSLPLGAVRTVVSAIDYANPLTYISFDIDANGAITTYALANATLALALIALIGSGIAIFRWQRLEA